MKNLEKSLDKAKFIAQLAQEKKGKDIVLMDMSQYSSLCDWFVLVSADSLRRVDTISKSIQKLLSKEKVRPTHVEGRQGASWMLIDYGDVVVHVFYKDIREYYALERLWNKAPKEEMTDDGE